jgi:hypothetical protein
MPFKGIDGKEKDLENLIVENLQQLSCDEFSLMPIFQERQWQKEPDIVALDCKGNLVIFELKRYCADEDATLQIIRYAQEYGQMTYFELENEYKKYKGKAEILLSEAHRDAFQLEERLSPEVFNRKQRLIIIGNSSNEKLIKAVEYWRVQGLDIDFIPYRFYEIGKETYFEFFTKPYDEHLNPADRKGIIFDSNKSYDDDEICI